jgi:hypothetical protein
MEADNWEKSAILNEKSRNMILKREGLKAQKALFFSRTQIFAVGFSGDSFNIFV